MARYWQGYVGGPEAVPRDAARASLLPYGAGPLNQGPVRVLGRCLQRLGQRRAGGSLEIFVTTTVCLRRASRRGNGRPGAGKGRQFGRHRSTTRTARSVGGGGPARRPARGAEAASTCIASTLHVEAPCPSPGPSPGPPGQVGPVAAECTQPGPAPARTRPAAAVQRQDRRRAQSRPAAPAGSRQPRPGLLPAGPEAPDRSSGASAPRPANTSEPRRRQRRQRRRRGFSPPPPAVAARRAKPAEWPPPRGAGKGRRRTGLGSASRHPGASVRVVAGSESRGVGRVARPGRRDTVDECPGRPAPLQSPPTQTQAPGSPAGGRPENS